MGIVSTAIGQQFVYELSSLSGVPFQKKCFEHLSDLIPDLRYAAELKLVDRKGIDIYQISSSAKYDFNIAFQCKGLETRFDKSQYQQCMASLAALRKANVRINKYYMLVNLKSKYFDLTLKKALVDQIKLLVTDKIANSAQLLDAEAFTGFLGGMIQLQLSKQIQRANNRFAKDYTRNMNQKFYYESIPYQIGNKNGSNAADYVINKTIDIDKNTLRSTGKNWILVISEFGFGKTSLLFHLFDRIRKHKQRCLYIPVALFSRDDFLYTTKFASRLLKIIEGRDIDLSLTYNKVRSRLLHYQLQHENDQIILMIDGLDEQEELFKQDILKIFFKHISVFKCPIIFTIRKEMWDERYGNFSAALGKGNKKNKVKLMLDEWDDNDILSYLDIHSHSVRSGIRAKKNIAEFRRLVEKGSYEKYYGDIPRRPLFLEMLISDIGINRIQHRNISEIYSIYLKNKFLIDRQGAFSGHAAKRPLSVSEDINKTFGIIFAILSKVAAKMVIGIDKSNSMILSSYIEEKTVEKILAESGIPKTVELMLHSVLVPFGVRTNDNISLKFAHKSFQEFFLARSIYQHILFCLESEVMISDINTIHTEGVNQFLAGFIKGDFPENELSSILENIRQYYPDIVPNSLAEFLLQSFDKKKSKQT